MKLIRQIQITIPNQPEDLVNKVMEVLKSLSIKYMIHLKGEQNSLIILRRKPTRVAEVIDKLNEIGIGVSYGIIDILKIEATIPEYAATERGDRKEGEFKERISLQEIQRIIEEGSRPTFNYFIFIIISAIIAGAGLLLNSAAVIIASMILSPIMGPILGVSFGIIGKKSNLIKDGLISQITGICIAIGLGIVIALLSILFTQSQVITQEMIARNFPSYLDLIIAIFSGLAVGFCITGGIAATLVGAAIAVALMPPAVNVGLALIYGDPLLSLGSFLLLLTNILAINFCAIIVFKIKKVSAPPEMMLFWRGPTELQKAEEGQLESLKTRISNFFKRKTKGKKKK